MPITLEPLPLPEEMPEPRYDFYHIRDGNRLPVADFLFSIVHTDRDVFYDRMRVLANRGRENMNPCSFRRLRGDYREVYEFKTAFGSRLACFFDGRRCILVEGWKKQTAKAARTDKQHYDRALARKREYERQQGEHHEA